MNGFDFGDDGIVQRFMARVIRQNFACDPSGDNYPLTLEINGTPAVTIHLGEDRELRAEATQTGQQFDYPLRFAIYTASGTFMESIKLESRNCIMMQTTPQTCDDARQTVLLAVHAQTGYDAGTPECFEAFTKLASIRHLADAPTSGTVN